MFLSMLRLPKMEILLPKNETEAVQILLKNKGAEFIAGGTDLIPRIRGRKARPSALIDLSGLNGLRYIKPGKNFIRVGALTTLAELLSHPEILRHRAFKAMAEKHTSPTIVNQATVGGNLWLRSAIGDLSIIMLAMNGKVKIRGGRGVRVIPYERFMAARKVRSLLTEAQIPAAAPGRVTLFDKLTVSVSKIPLASIAIHLRADKRRGIREARVVVSCARGDRLGRVPVAERSLKGMELDDEEEEAERAAERLAKSIKPHSDFMAPDWYRREALKTMFKRLLAEARSILGGGAA